MPEGSARETTSIDCVAQTLLVQRPRFATSAWMTCSAVTPTRISEESEGCMQVLAPDAVHLEDTVWFNLLERSL